MKFFSNESKENDGPDYDRTNVATSEPVAVPQQRAGSPWTNAPGSTDDEPDDRDRRDSTTFSDISDKDTDRLGDDDPRHDHPDTGTEPYGEDDLTATTADRDDTAPADGTLKDDGTFDSPRAVEPATGEPLSDRDTGSPADSALTDRETDTGRETDTDRDVDADLDADTDRETGSYSETDPDADPDRVTDPDRATGGDTPTGTADTDTFADAGTAPVTTDRSETATDTDATPVDADDASASPAGSPVDAVPVAAAVAVPAAATAGTGSAAAGTGSATGTDPASPDRLFADSDAFAGRFREIQLRFVDSPKDATAEAAALVAEAVDQLTSALNEQKNRLASDSDDTEKLRVELRGYRDLMNRLLAL